MNAEKLLRSVLPDGSKINVWKHENSEINLESVMDAAKEADALLKEHWLEIANYKDTVPLSPRWEDIYALEKKGDIVLLTLRQDEKLIGYSMFVLRVHLHYKSLICADNDILFVRSDKRKSKLGVQLIIESDRCLKAMGVDKITWHMKPHKSFAPILERLGYIHEELIYGRLLNDHAPG